MRPECIKAVANALGRAVTVAEGRAIEARIIKAKETLASKDRAGWHALPEAERLKQAGEHAAKELLGEARLKADREAKGVTTLLQLDQRIQDHVARGMSEQEAVDQISAGGTRFSERKVARQGDSIEYKGHAIAAEYISNVLDTIQTAEPKWFGLLQNMEGVRDVVRAIWKEPGASPEAMAGAKPWLETAERARERANRAGAAIHSLEDWGHPHHWDQRRTANAAGQTREQRQAAAKAGIDLNTPEAHRDHWVSRVFPKLQRDRYVNEDGTLFDDVQMRDFLREAWHTIATGGVNKQTPGAFRGKGMLADRGSAERQIHIKSADDWLELQQEFGGKSLYDVLMSHLDGMGRDIANLETAGPNADQTMRFLRERAFKNAVEKNPRAADKARKRMIQSEALYNEVSGKTQPVASQFVADMFDTARSVLASARLGFAPLNSFADLGTALRTVSYNGLDDSKFMANELAAFNPANKLEERLLNRAGLGHRVMRTSLVRFGEEGLGRHWSAKLGGASIRASGLNAWTGAHERAFGATMMDALGSLSRRFKSLATLPEHDRTILQSKGVTDTDWQVWRLADTEDWGGHGNGDMLTPESIYRIPDADLAALGDPTKVREQAVTHLLAHILEETDFAVVFPGARDRAFMYRGLERGTIRGELTRSIWQFKGYSTAVIRRHFIRAMSEPNAGGRAKYIAALIASTTALGMASVQMNEIARGKDPKQVFGPHGGRTWLEAFLKGGPLGLYADLIINDNPRRGIYDMLGGPLIGTASDAYDVATKVKAGEGVGVAATRLVQGVTPFANLWYAKAAVDHLIFNQIFEMFSPGYLRKVAYRTQRQTGQGQWWGPEDAAPTRAPDLEAMVPQ